MVLAAPVGKREWARVHAWVGGQEAGLAEITDFMRRR